MFSDTPRILDAPSTLKLTELTEWLRAERDSAGRPLEDLLVAPVERQLEAVVDACKTGSFPFVPNFQAATVSCRLDELATAIRAGDINCLAIEVYPDSECLSLYPQVAAFGVAEFHVRNLSPILDPGFDPVSDDDSDDERDTLREFRSGAGGELVVRFMRAFADAGVADSTALPAKQFLRMQCEVFEALPPQPTMTEAAGHISIRFSSTRPTIAIPKPSRADHGFLSLSHIITHAPGIGLLTPVEWLFVAVLANRLDRESFTYGTPLGGVTSTDVLCATRTRFCAGIAPRPADYGSGGVKLSLVI